MVVVAGRIGVGVGGSMSPGPRPTRYTWAQCRAVARAPSPLPSGLLGVGRRLQQYREFFWHLHESLSPLRPPAPPRCFPRQLGDLLVPRVAPAGSGRVSWMLLPGPSVS